MFLWILDQVPARLSCKFFLRTNVQAACGIEIAEQPHKIAVKAAEYIQNELPEFYENERKVHLLQGDFLELPFTQASVILLSSPCFTPSMLETVGAMINQMQGIHTVISLRPLLALTRIRFKTVISLECSWDTALCYIYMN